MDTGILYLVLIYTYVCMLGTLFLDARLQIQTKSHITDSWHTLKLMYVILVSQCNMLYIRP